MSTQPIETLLIFARFPEPNKTKTRLIPALGPSGAAKMYTAMAEAVCGEVRTLKRPNYQVVVYVEPAERVPEVEQWLGDDFEFESQPTGDLGERLFVAFQTAFERGSQRVVAIGTDCVEISSNLLNSAFDALKQTDAVIGPALDGGYYLLGMRRFFPVAFSNISWSSDTTCAETLKQLSSAGATIQQLKTLSDIDTPADLDSLPLSMRAENG